MIGVVVAAESGDLLLVGIVLLSILVVFAVESVAYTRGGFNQAFWDLPVDDKLDHIALHKKDWWLLGITSMATLAVVGGGISGLAGLLAAEGAPAVAWVSFGGFLLALIAAVVWVVVQIAAVWPAAEGRHDSGTTADWLQPFWAAAYAGEITWIMVANLAYVGLGAAILQTDLLGAWAGWVAIIGGLAVPLGVAVFRTGFPQLALIVPLVLGVALVLAGV